MKEQLTAKEYRKLSRHLRLANARLLDSKTANLRNQARCLDKMIEALDEVQRAVVPVLVRMKHKLHLNAEFQ